MRTFTHSRELEGLYICPDYTVCRNSRTPCGHGVPHRIVTDEVCVERKSYQMVPHSVCTHLGQKICDLHYCRPATEDDAI
jgi:hypothetical protein